MGRQIRKEEKVAEFELALKELNGVSAEMSEMEFAAVREARRSISSSSTRGRTSTRK
jgi:hypothetical protein